MDLQPDLLLNNTYELDLQLLRDQHITTLIFDLDNTLVCETTVLPTDEVRAFLDKLAYAGFKVGVVSNNRKERVETFMNDLSIPYFYLAHKPSPDKVLEMMNVLHAKKEETAMIGDRLTTDILVGKRAGVYTILVKPIGKDIEMRVKCVRLLEKLWLKWNQKKKQ